MDIDDDEYYPPPAAQFSSNFDNGATHRTSSPAVDPHATGDDAYMQRLRMSDMSNPTNPQAPSETAMAPPPSAAPQVSAPAPITSAATPPINLAAQMAAAKAKLAAAKAKIDAQHAQNGKTAVPSPTPPTEPATLPLPPPPTQPQDTSMIAKGPVLYNLPGSQVDALVDRQMAHAQPGTMSTSQAPAPAQSTSKVSGQKGFAARLMAKMGWEEGQGLGAKGEGITTAIVAQATKRKRRSDKEGGGWMPSVGKIVGGKKRKVQTMDDDEGEFGNMSNIVKLQGMLDELDVTYEIEENNLLQEIGEQFSNDYGAIERLFIWREQNGGNNEVFVKFTNQLSALKACGGTNEMTFAGNPVKARFFDAEKFENGEYA
jgi:splicing factor 45